MKKLLAILIVLVLCVSVLAACEDMDFGAFDFGGQNENNEKIEQQEKDEQAQIDLAAAYDIVYSMYKDLAAGTAADYEVIAQVLANEKTFAIDWSVLPEDPALAEFVQIGEVKDGMLTISVKASADQDVAYKLIATITIGERTVSVEFNHFVPQYHEFNFEDYLAAKKGDSVTVKGVISGIIRSSDKIKSLYLNDEVGGYYVYTMNDASAALDLKVGQTVKAIGVLDIYYGTYELKDASIEIIDENLTELVPTDYTEIYENAASLKDASLTKNQAHLVTIEGVEITGISPDNNSYYCFKLGELESYVRISSSACPLSSAEQEAFIAAYQEHIGWIANVTGLITVYNDSFYLTPVSVDAFVYTELPEKSGAEAVAAEKSNLNVAGLAIGAQEIDLPANGVSYEDVAIDWAIEGETAVASIVDGKLVISAPAASETVKLVATLSAGNDSDTKEFEVFVTSESILAASQEEVVKAAYHLAKGQVLGSYALTGVITKVDTAYSEQYKNVTVTIQIGDLEDMPIQCFRMKGEGADVIAEGYTISVTGSLKNYNGTIEFDSGCTLDSFAAPANDEATDAEKVEAEKALLTMTESVAGAIEIDLPAAGKTYADVAITWEISESTVASISEGKLIIAASDEAAEITLTATISVGEASDTKEFVIGILPLLDTPEKIVNAAYELATNATLPGGAYTLTGVITKVDTAYSEQYKNVTVTIQVGDMEDKPIQCFRIKGEGADVIAVGDTITVRGTIKNYNGTVEFDSGSALLSYVKPAAETEFDITVSVEHATVVTSIEKGVSGASFTITISEIEEGYEIVAVTVNGVAAEVGTEENVYVGTVNGPTSVVVTLMKAAVAPEAGSNYVFYLDQVKLGKTLYYTGSMSGNFLAMSENKADAALVTIAQTEDGYTFFANGKYINLVANGTKAKIALGDEPTFYWAWDATLGVFTCTIENCGVFYLGTYSNYSTISASATSYISGDNMAQIGVSQFPAYFLALSEEEIVAAEKASLVAPEEIQIAGETDLAEKGTVSDSVVISWALDKEYDFVSITEGKLVVTALPAEETEILLTAIVILNNTTDSVSFTVKVAAQPTSPADKIAAEKAQLPEIAAEVNEAVEIDLPAVGKEYEDVSITWALDQEYAFAAIAEGKLTIALPTDADTTIKLTATLACGEESDTFEYTIVVITPLDTPEKIVLAAYALADKKSLEGTYELTGVVTSIATAYSTQYHNISVWMQIGDLADNPIEAYRLVGTDAADASLIEVGDTITVSGSLMRFNSSTVEFAAACELKSLVKSAANKIATEKAALAIAASVAEPTSIALASSSVYSDVVIEWALDKGYEFAAIENGALVISALPAENTVVTLTATLTCDGKSDTAVFEINVVAAGGTVPVSADPVALVDLAFGPSYNSKANSSYTETWTATKDNQTWTLYGFNNNNNGWDYVKCGRKGNASVGTITTTIAGKVTTFTAVFGTVRTAKVNSLALIVKNGDNVVATINATIVSGGSVTFEIPEEYQAYGLTYTLSIDCASDTSNGTVTLNSISVVGYEPAEIVAETPAVTVEG